MTTPKPTNAELEVRRRIEERGPMTFAELMAIALYWPNGGYYTTREAFGASGDFYTAPLAHPAFGALVARQVLQMHAIAGLRDPWWVIEAGAGTGQLSADVRDAIENAGGGMNVRHVAIDRGSPAHAPAGVSWVRSPGLPLRGVRGVVLANELFDAMPVHRVTVEGGALREIRVGIDGAGRLVDVLSDPSPGIAERLAEERVLLGEGHRAEVCLALDEWFDEASRAVDAGYLLLFDYGHEADAYYDASRRRGTLRTYHRHTLGMDPYSLIGRQDISVHVDLTALRNAANRAGWADAGSTTQAGFLRNLGWDAVRRQIAERRDIPAQVRVANARALDTLVAPEGMGGFRAVAFAKNVPSGGLWGFAGGAPEYDDVAPLAAASHMPFGAPQQGYEVSLPSWDELLK